MDKRFFLALFLSLIVIAISQLLFPPIKPPVPSSRVNVAKDSLANSVSSVPAVTQKAVPTASRDTPSTALAVEPRVSLTAAETTTVVSPKAIYKFVNVGATPVSVEIRDYSNRAAGGGAV